LKRVRTIHIILIAGLLHGLLYVFLLPPWQHYDEPGHFEYAWLIANRPGLPKPGEYDQAMRREVAASMVEYNFFKDIAILPNLMAQNQAVWIGISQTDNPPLYYWIAALPLRLVPTSDITFQLYLVRLVSVPFYLLTILTAYKIIAELTPPEHLFRWLIPATLVLLPGFTELMTAVNSDVGSVAFFSLFLWAGLRLMVRGFNIQRLVAAGLLAGACILTKNTAAVAAPLLILPLLFSLLRGRRVWMAWGVLGASIPIGLLLIFTTGDVANWYQPDSQIAPTRLSSPLAPLGAYAFQLDSSTRVQANSLAQLLSPSQVQSLRGKKVTLGYWIWSDQPVKTSSPILKDDQRAYSELVEVTSTPTFHAFIAKISGSTQHIQIDLASPGKAGMQVYVDGLVLVRGDLTQSGTPVWTDVNARRGNWAGKAFENPIRNASAEQGWPRLRTPVQELLAKTSPIRPNMILASLADWQNSRWYYRTTLKQLARTFWGQFGWGQISLPRNVLIALSLLTAIGGLGSLVGLARNRQHISWSALVVLVIASLWIWGAALMRGVQSIVGAVFIPSARYAYPAIIPTVLALCAGWMEGPRWLERRLRLPGWVKNALYLTLFLALDALSIWTIARFYGKV
jgi:hypothetical protein